MRGFSGYGSVFLLLALGSTFQATPNGITYTCDSNPNDPGYVNPTTCSYLNTTIAGLYNTTFSNANANIYISYGAFNGLAESQAAYNLVPYSSYLNNLTNTNGGDTVDVDALAALNSLDTAVYGSGNVALTSALDTALGFTTNLGVSAFGNTCFSLGSNGCYDGVITVTTPANLSSLTGGQQSLYYRDGTTQSSNAYDLYSVVEHETDEILGTASCINTQGTSLAYYSYCGSGSSGAPSAVDLFRYSGAGQLVNDASLSTTPGAYFSYNGGVSNGADGAVYNTLADGEDYADFLASCQFVQDTEGCLGKSLDITNDGGAEINILNAEGFNLTTPEPATVGTMGLGFTTIGVVALRRRRIFA